MAEEKQTQEQALEAKRTDTTSDDGGSVDKGGANFVPKEKYNTVNEKLKAIAAEREELSNKLKAIESAEEAKRQEKLLEEKKYEELLSEKSNKLKEVEAQVAEVKRQNEEALFKIQLKSAVKEAGAYDIDDVEKFISISDFQRSESGEFVGIEEKLTELKTRKPYLFSNGKGVVKNQGQDNKPGVTPPDAMQFGNRKPSVTDMLNFISINKGK